MHRLGDERPSSREVAVSRITGHVRPSRDVSSTTPADPGAKIPPMNGSEIIDLADYRRERERRRRETFALYGADGERSRLVLQLWRAVSAVDGDRAATVWVDEYGSGLAHAYCVLDLAADPPRREFTPEPLKRAWECGVPGLLDVPDVARADDLPVPEEIRSVAAVSLGSDGVKAWFLVTDSRTPRAMLGDAARSELMFSAGEAAGLLLHRDLGSLAPDEAAGGDDLDDERFAGWRVLRDIEGREDDDRTNRRITRRFLVVRLVRSIADEGFVVSPAALSERLESVRDELADVARTGTDPESDAWRTVVDAVESMEPARIAEATLTFGECVENEGHYHGAVEIYQAAYEAAAAAGTRGRAVDAARFQARAFRKLADFAEAEAWYARAEEMAEALGDEGRLAVIVSGRANVLREKGNLPAARTLLVSGLEEAADLDDSYPRAVLHHGLATVQKQMGDVDDAIVQAWRAFGAYEESAHRASALHDLAGIFLDREWYEAADDAYALALTEPEGEFYRILALGGRAFTGAVTRGAETYEARRKALDENEWRSASPSVRAQILYYQGRALHVLNRTEDARAHLSEALECAEEYGFNKLIFDAEEALDRLEETAARPAPASRTEDVPRPVVDVMHDLRSEREAVAEPV